jgi:hypothetical protein
MRGLPFVLLALLPTAGWAGPTTAPDLDVTHISITPRPPSYQPRYYGGYGHPVDPNTNAEIPLEQAQAIKHYHAPGDIVTFTAHVVNHGQAPSASFTYTWTVDGTVIGTGSSEALAANARATGNGTYTVRGFNGNPNGYTYKTATLTPGTFADFSITWPWVEGPHQVSFTVTPQAGSPVELSTRNNTRTDWTDAMAFFMTVRRSAYNAFTTVKNFVDTGTAGYPAGPGSYSFEDWVQYHVDLTHDKFAKSVYPTAPQGIKEHIRLDTLLILDDTEPNENLGDLRAVNGWDSTWPFGNYPSGNAQTKDWGLPHEWGHQLGLMDLYNLDLIPSENKALDVDGYPTGLGRTAHQGGMMRNHGDTIFAESDALALNSQVGRRRGWYGDFQYLIPLQNRVRVLNTAGLPVANAEVLAYQTKPITNTPVFQGTTDADGYFALPNRPAAHNTTEYKPGATTLYTQHDNPFGTVDVVGNASSLLFRVRSGSERAFFWLDITDFNRAYWTTGPDAAVYPFNTHFPAADSPAAPENVSARLTSATSVQLKWDASTTPGVTGYRVYKAVEPEYLWQEIANVTGTGYTDTVDTRQIVRYAVTARGNGPDSGFSHEVGLYSYADMRGIAGEADGTILVTDYPREQPIWLRPNLSPIEAFGSVHNHVAAFDVAVLPDGFVASVGGPVGYEPGPASGLLVVPPDGSNFNGQPNRSRLVRTNGPALSQWAMPEGLAVGRPGPTQFQDIVVTDTGNHRVEVMASDARTSKLVFGQADLTHPVDTVQTNDGTYVVTDPGANRLARFDSAGTFLGAVPMQAPAYIALAADGNIAVSSANTVVLLGPDLSVTKTITAADGVDLSRPQGVAFTPNGDLLIADAGNRRVVRVPLAPVVVWGDVDGNNAFETEDLLLALRIASGLEASTMEQIQRGDVVKGPNLLPDEIDIRDVVALTQKAGA